MGQNLLAIPIMREEPFILRKTADREKTEIVAVLFLSMAAWNGRGSAKSPSSGGSSLRFPTGSTATHL
jgi:hypothetical protein